MRTDLITTDDLAALAQQDAVTLATAWDTLNCFDWPKWLDNPEPETYIHGGRRSQLMDWIAEAVGLRMCFRYSKPHSDSSEEEFNDFWRGNFRGANGVRPRRIELVRMGLVRDSGLTRRTRAGRSATVWVATGASE